MGDHYIPKYYLLGFSDLSEKPSLWVYDREIKTQYKTQPKSTANSTKLYSKDVETYLANEIENPVQAIFEKIRCRVELTIEEKSSFSKYIYALYKRVPKAKNRLKLHMPKVATQVKDSIFENIDQLVHNDPTLYEKGQLRKQEVTNILLRQTEVPDAALWYHSIKANGNIPIKTLAAMKWVFWINQKDNFFTSDNPVFFFESLGLTNPRAELSFPISSDICLWATHRLDIVDNYQVANQSVCKELNRRTVSNSTRFIYWKKQENWISAFLSKNNWKLNRIV